METSASFLSKRSAFIFPICQMWETYLHRSGQTPDIPPCRHSLPEMYFQAERYDFHQDMEDKCRFLLENLLVCMSQMGKLGKSILQELMIHELIVNSIFETKKAGKILQQKENTALKHHSIKYLIIIELFLFILMSISSKSSVNICADPQEDARQCGLL